MHASDVIDTIITAAIAPLMKQQGFRKQRHLWWRIQDSVVDVIDVQKSHWNEACDARFALNLGLYWPEIHTAIKREAKNFPPKIPECTITERLGPLFNGGRDFWWTVRSESEVTSIGADVCDKIVRFGIPWLDRRHDLKNTLHYARKHSRSIVQREILFELENKAE